MGIFISVPKTIECVIIALFFGVLTCCCSLKHLGVLQSLGYNGKKYLKWNAKKGNTAYLRLFFLAAASFVCSVMLAYLFAFTGEWAAVISLAAYLIFFAVYVYADSKVAIRVRFTFTSRFKRLILTEAFLCGVVAYVFVTFLNFGDYVWDNAFFGTVKYALLFVIPLLVPVFVYLSNGLAKAFEIPYNNSFIKKAKKKIAASNVKIIAITGSYGKTSVKNALNTILREKFKTLATPHSYNTPMGVAKTVNDNSLADVDVLIVEMGARNKGDISELCDICPPDYSCITGVCEQHLETFKSLQRVIETKAEIIKPTKNKTFIATDVYDNFVYFGEKVVCCDCAENVVADCNGTVFTLKLGDETKKVRTKLLGEHSARNIAVACSVAYALGMTLDEIAAGIKKINFTDHRLQLIKAGDINVLDDGYNSNPVGARYALNVLRSFGGRKIVVTPGLVELGVIEDSANRELGAAMVGLDVVILVGETQLLPLKEGYLSAGGDAEKLIIVPTLTRAQDSLKGVLTSGDTVLFMNDLPEVY